MNGRPQVGDATIYGGSINPLQVLINNGNLLQRQKAEQHAAAVKQRDKLIDDLEKHSPDKVWEPFHEQVAKHAQGIRDLTFNALDKGIPIPKIQQNTSRMWSDNDTLAARSRMHKETYTDAKNQLKTNANFYNIPEATSALNNIFFEGGQGRDINSIDTDQIAPQVFDNPDLFNKQNVFMQFMKELPERTNKYYTEVYNPLGQQYNVADTATKLGIQTDEKGHPVMDPRTGMPKISMTDDVYIQAKQDPFISKILKKEVPDGNVQKERQYLTAMLEGYDPKHIANSRQMGFRFPKDNGEASLEGSTIVNGGDNNLKDYENIGSDKKVGFDNLSFGYSANTQIPISTTQGGAANQTGSFSGLRTNPTTGKKEMEFVTSKPFGGEKEIKYVPYDEKTFQQVLNSLPAKKRGELRNLKNDFDKQFDQKKEYVLNEQQLNSDADAIGNYYKENKGKVGSEEFNKGLSEMFNRLGLDKKGESHDWQWYNPFSWGASGVKLNGETIDPTTTEGKDKIKKALYDLQKGKYKSEAGKQPKHFDPNDPL